MASPLPDKDPKKPKKTFKVWPEVEGLPYGPQPKQRLLFIEDLPDVDCWLEDSFTGDRINIRRPHYHPIDCVLLIGGARAGKSAASVARVVTFLLKNPGSQAIIGATTYPILQRNALKDWGDLFKDGVPWGMSAKPGSLLKKKPTQNEKTAVFGNGSRASFLHLTDDENLRGINADIIHMEEASLIPDEASFEELGRRLSGRKGPVRQIILSTNPTGSSGSWIDEKFKLHQFRADFKGDPEPICRPCRCHLCARCLQLKSGEMEFRDGLCENCGYQKQNDCPGNQVWMRVIQMKSADNRAVPDDYGESMKEFMGERTFKIFVEGSTDDLRASEVYKSFTDDNILKQEDPISFEKDLIWTLDFNFEPQCSVICQEEETSAGFQVKVLDEIVMWDALPADAAEEFCRRPDVLKWRESGRMVLIYGDPAGLYGTGNNLQPSFYKIIYDVLTRNGFAAKILMRKPDPNALIKEQVKIHVGPRVDSVNLMLRSEVDGQPTVRLRVNPNCKNLIRSLREVRWSADGSGIDKLCDRRAARRADKTNAVMTHPTDALGYYIYKRFPILRNKPGTVIFQVPGQSTVMLRGGKVSEVDRSFLQKELMEAKDKRREERRKLRDEKSKTNSSSLGSWLREQGLWGDSGTGSLF